MRPELNLTTRRRLLVRHHWPLRAWEISLQICPHPSSYHLSPRVDGGSLSRSSRCRWTRGGADSARPLTRQRVGFTIAKARRLIVYNRTTPTWRQVAVVLFFPVPGLVASLITPFIPLQDPALGAKANLGFYPHAFLTAGFTLLGATIQAREVTGISHNEVSSFEISMVALIATTNLILMIGGLCWVWRFPVPFSWVLAYAPWMMSFVLGWIVVLRQRLFKSSHIRSRLLLFMPLLSLQVSQIVLYPAYSAVFEAAGFYSQLVLIMLFPLLKYVLKRSIILVSHHFRDFALEEGVCSVEISASMYQSMIMQTTPSPLAIALVIGIDLVIGVIDVKRFIDRNFATPRTEIIAKAFSLLEDDANPIEEHDLCLYAAKKAAILPETMTKNVKRMSAAILPRKSMTRIIGMNGVRSIVPTRSVMTTSSRKRMLSSDIRKERQIVTQALEVLQSAESILLVEYLEVVVPIVNALYVAVASQLPSAVYNPKMRSFDHNPSALNAAIATIVLYASLQGLTFVAICAVMRLRFRLSALTLLAFLIEGRAWSLQGKMLAWVPFTFAFCIVHYGVDFTFRFDFTIPPPR